MKFFINNFLYNDISDLRTFCKLFSNIFGEETTLGKFENSEILLESIFGKNTFLNKKKWLYTFLFIGESDRRLPIFLKNGMNNKVLNDYSCILKGGDNFNNIINFPLFVAYSYSLDFTYNFKKPYFEEGWEKCFNINPKISKIPKKNICVIISNGNDSEGRNFYIEQLEKRVQIDYAGNYKNNVEKPKGEHCSPEFIDFVSQYKIIIAMENSKNNNYITEKILHGFSANTIPVYWGSDNIHEYFNKERFINVKDFEINTINDSIEQIVNIIEDDNKFLEIINKPIYNNIVYH